MKSIFALGLISWIILVDFACGAREPGGVNIQGQIGRTGEADRHQDPDEDWDPWGEDDRGRIRFEIPPLQLGGLLTLIELENNFTDRLWAINVRQGILQEFIDHERTKPREDRDIDDLEDWREELEELNEAELETWEQLDLTRDDFQRSVRSRLRNKANEENRRRDRRGRPPVDVRDPRIEIPAPRPRF